VPRWSATIVEPRIQRLLDHLNLSVEGLADPHAADGQVARAHLSSDAERALSGLRADMRTDIERLRQSSRDLVPDKVMDGLARSIEHRLERAERRLLAGVKRREVDAMRQLATVRGSLFPHGVRQERKLAYIPFLARYGQPLLDRMLGESGAHAQSLVGGRTSVLSSPVDAPARV